MLYSLIPERPIEEETETRITEATGMKDVSKISKSFTCECGTVNKFEFETDFDVHDVTMAVRCQECSREKNISLMSFFRRAEQAQAPSALNPVAFDNAMLPVGDLIAAAEQPSAAIVEPVQEQAAIDSILSPPMTAQQKAQRTADEEEEMTHEEKEAFSDLFGKL